MKHLKGKWKRIKTQNKITFHKILKIISNLNLSKNVLSTRIPKNPKRKNIIFCLIVALKYFTR